VDERGVPTQYYGSTALDASLLLAPLVRFLPPDDPRIRAKERDNGSEPSGPADAAGTESADRSE
jgi:hypothetical protein